MREFFGVYESCGREDANSVFELRVSNEILERLLE